MANKVTFESAIEQLDKIVDELETGDIPLEQAIKKFEEGVKLSQICTKRLDETEEKMSMLIKTSDGQLKNIPFE
ncbi:MAG: exodeoxyribonuclease VII small subunit [Candidatus Magnetoglobus multicellularis str. Araruama]|uniref:Exodeoxyribonuclease 7 small subunit n=1 Tax=Candidatus Magnetoglobus multicellularis str. Araruama TaxID=890399 RepID=A0A1V1P6Z9_9BACT|nr:MAG: exodeoxyribonuclease VII small subunit [Candidatus Magnetoglobus multicellularis str. Araruama]